MHVICIDYHFTMQRGGQLPFIRLIYIIIFFLPVWTLAIYYTVGRHDIVMFYL